MLKLNPGTFASDQSDVRKSWLILPALYLLWWYRFVDAPPGVLVWEEPDQRAAVGVAPWELKGSQVVPLAEYRLRARLLAREHYWFDRASQFSPFDFAVGWGPMSDQSVLDQLDWSQSARFLHWRPRQPGLQFSVEEMSRRSANIHIIPADTSVLGAMTFARAGEVVQMTGYLVEIIGPGSARWKSSLSRTDTGAGACEIMWVTGFLRE